MLSMYFILFRIKCQVNTIFRQRNTKYLQNICKYRKCDICSY